MHAIPSASPSLSSSATRRNIRKEGLRFKRLHSRAGEQVLDSVAWELRDACITGSGGKVVFKQSDVEIPSSWSRQAGDIVASKYFRGHQGSPEREVSVRQVIRRVVDAIHAWAVRDNVFADRDNADSFRDELTWILLHQHAAFNSPVWFNVGVHPHPQCSACFINSVSDDMESIMSLAATEARLFKGGSGAGSNLSKLRSSKEPLAGGGMASGPVSFMKGFDAFAGVIKSGGKTRRAAKMVILNADHPDINEFVGAKANEEKKAWALIDAGYDGSLDGEAYGSVYFQNANHSVRVSDAFMEAVENDGTWNTIHVTDGTVCESMPARRLFRKIADAAWTCGDPGLQFDSTINRAHTCSNTDRIHSSNPCSEYMFLDDTACNLASLNLMRYRQDDGGFDSEAFIHDVTIVITAMEILVGNSAYPTEAITRNSHDYRPLGIGYANLGALLMSLGLPYDSNEGRSLAAAITAMMSGAAYAQSARLAAYMGPFAGFAANREPMNKVIEAHRAAIDDIDQDHVPHSMLQAAAGCWDKALELGREHGWRNSQISVLAPTGTIAFMMDCDTTGVEPDIALIKYKHLVGGGTMKIVNRTVPMALAVLGYDSNRIDDILSHLDQRETIEGAPHLRSEHLAVFDCAFRPKDGVRSIEPMGHVRMMAAVQPFLSGAISKTVNLPTSATVEDIEKTYLSAWRLGVKAIAVYRDGCKRIQPLSTSKTDKAVARTIPLKAVETTTSAPRRRRLPDERQSLTHKFNIGGHEGYLTVGVFDDGSPGELFVVMSKEGSTISGLMDAFATSVSIMLQYGVPLEVLITKFSSSRFEPEGWTSHPQIRYAHSITDYIFRWIALKFQGSKPALTSNDVGLRSTDTLDVEVEEPSMPFMPPLVTKEPAEAERRVGFEFGGPVVRSTTAPMTAQLDAPPCSNCGRITVRNGSCYRCWTCGSSTGCS